MPRTLVGLNQNIRHVQNRQSRGTGKGDSGGAARKAGGKPKAHDTCTSREELTVRDAPERSGVVGSNEHQLCWIDSAVDQACDKGTNKVDTKQKDDGKNLTLDMS